MTDNKTLICIPSSSFQTKEWRKSQIWYQNGKHNECEIYQIILIEKIIKQKLLKTNERINIEKNKIINKKNPFKKENGFDYTENFDGKITYKDDIIYFNLKFIGDKGGSQTRTLKEVYFFIKCQLEYLLYNETDDIYFINILDGDTCFNSMDKFNYLLNKKEYKNIKKYIYIGDTYDFQNYWIKKFK